MAGLQLDFVICPGFGWNRVSFFLSSWCSVVLWIWDGNNVNTQIFQVSLSGAHPQSRLFHVSGGRRLGTADPNWAKGYPIPHKVMSSL